MYKLNLFQPIPKLRKEKEIIKKWSPVSEWKRNTIKYYAADYIMPLLCAKDTFYLDRFLFFPCIGNFCLRFLIQFLDINSKNEVKVGLIRLQPH